MRPIVFSIGLILVSAGALANTEGRSTRSQVAGIDLITYKTEVKNVVVISGAFPAGDAMGEPGNIAVPTLMGMMLDRGTKSMDKFAISNQLENVGAEISFSVGPESVQVHGKCLKKDLGMVLGLIAADLRTPALQSQEFNKARQQFIGVLQSQEQNTDARSEEAFGRAIFPAGHPNRPHTIPEFEAAAKAVTLDEVKAFYARYYGPAHFTLVVAGDVDSGAAQEEVTKSFSGWSGGQDYLRPSKPAALAAATQVTVPLADKPSVSMIIGQPTGLTYKDPDALALRIGTAVLGGGFTGRLMSTVRDKDGLTYGIGASVSEDAIADGSWSISATFAPALLARGVDATRQVLDTWWKGGITDQELAARKRGLIGGYQVGLSTTGGIASTILVDAQRGYGVEWIDELPVRINALTRDQVNAAIKKHLNPAAMALVEAGSVPH
ncbi:MAG TPA: pitrilysin family protein [Steroidobacteraceae bacterium]|jgi:zinc protease|nr:pitrilysin family protein [Steroidobacteraceae bacterium]